MGGDASARLEALQARVAGKLHAASDPFAEFAGDIFGDKGDMGVAADELEIGGIACGSGKDEIGEAVGRGDNGPGTAGTIAARQSVPGSIAAA